MQTSSRSIRPWHVSAFALTIWLGVALTPVWIGRESFFFRDLGTTHIPLRAVRASIGNARTNPYASFGEPYLGNPNALAAYPFPSGPRWISIHVLSHIALAFAGALLLLRLLGLSADAAFFGALSFGLSGYVLSAASSLNAITSIAWLPWFLAGAVALRRARRPWLVALSLVPLAAVLSVSGEPVLIAMTIALGLCLAGIRRMPITAASLLAGYVLLLPVHRATIQTMADAYRVRTGYTFEEAASASFHPLRLLETLFPLMFGDPSKIGSGTYWGYRISNGAPPYVYSATLGVLTVFCAAAALYRGRGKGERGWLVLALTGLVLSMGSFIPGSRFLYEHVGLLHSLRFPIKFFLVCTLAMSVLAAYGFERLMLQRDAAANQAVSCSAWVAFALLLVIAFLAAANKQGLENLLVRCWWDSRWPSDPHSVLAAIVDAFPERLLVLACSCAALGWAVSSEHRWTAVLVLQLLLAADLLASGRHLFPTVAASDYDSRSPLVEALLRQRGRVFERAPKDLDPVRAVMRGEYPSNDARCLGIAQNRQGWALSGARFGLRYAYDHSADGSYTDRMVRVTDVLDRADWPLRMKWLRAAGVTMVIASDLGPEVSGLTPIARETSIGVPVTAYAVTDRWSEVRRIGTAQWVPKLGEAIRAFQSPGFDPAKAVILEGNPLPVDGLPGEAKLMRDAPDQVVVDTDGPTPAVLFIVRAYTRFATATVNGHPTTLYPANAHLCGVLVPKGASRVVVAF